ncbi:hypothetical protein AS200_01880 [Streptomyces sp. CdTB01]|nr:hypothetical protein AS200_01880 [Streptomyces sp. CdTB01]
MVTLLRASGGKETELTHQPTLADLQQLIANTGIETTLTGWLPPGSTPPAPAPRCAGGTTRSTSTSPSPTAPRPAPVPLPSARHGLIA